MRFVCLVLVDRKKKLLERKHVMWIIEKDALQCAVVADSNIINRSSWSCLGSIRRNSAKSFDCRKEKLTNFYKYTYVCFARRRSCHIASIDVPLRTRR